MAIQTVHILSGLATKSSVLIAVQTVLDASLPGIGCIHQSIGNAAQSDWETVFRQLTKPNQGALILTVGDIGPRGYLPDATQAVCHKLFPGFGTLLRQVGLAIQSDALLWRNTAGLCKQTLIVNLPDSIEVIRVGLPLLFPSIPNAVILAGK